MSATLTTLTTLTTLMRALVAVAVLTGASAVRAAGPTILGRITDPDGLPLPGVALTVRSAAGGPALTTVTDEAGRYAINAPAGRFRLRAELSGFQPVERVDLVVAAEPVVVDLTLPLASIEEEVTVNGEALKPVMGEPQPNAPVSVTREVVDAAMLPNSQYDDVLPLMPNVLRGPDGLISVAGARAPQGALFINGFNATDPINGQAGVMVPLEAVDSVQVYSGGYAAGFGRATGGVTSVITRSGADQLHMSLNSFFPRVLLQNGSIHGVQYWEPNFGVSGPIVKGRVHFEQALSYRFDRNRVNTLVGPQDSTFVALLSWSELDLQASPTQHVTATLSFDPQHTDHANITAFTPATSAPRMDQGGWSAALADRWTIGQESLELRVSAIHTSLAVVPHGTVPYQVGHDLTYGSYFDHQDLHGARLEASAVYTWTPSLRHLVRTGASLAYGALDGSEDSAPVALLRSDGTVSRSITFLPGGPLAASTHQIGAFAQDSWTASRWLTVDAGLRFDQTTSAAHPTLSPRFAWTFKPDGGHASLGGSIGQYADKLVLQALSFPSQPSRMFQSFDASGTPLGLPVIYANRLAAPLRVPQATRWDIQLDDRFGGGWLARAKYQERYDRDELIVDPVTAGGTGLLVLDNTGTSTARSIEVTAGYRAPRAGHEIYASYVRSSTRGDLNSFDVLNGPFRDPFVQPDAPGPLPMDAPNRMLVWSLLRFPARITAAPFIEVRDGFPYSAIDDDWAYVGPRNAYRLPWFGSLDLYVNKIVGLPGRLPDARIGLKLYNLASIHTARDVQRDIDRADFGATYNPIPRDFSFVFELLWGHGDAGRAEGHHGSAP